MATVKEVISDILATTELDSGGAFLARCLDNRYKELMSKVKPKQLRKVGELSVPGAIDSGTVTVTRGSTTVTPDATAQAAWVTSPGVGDQYYWQFRARNTWYTVSSIAALGATLELTSEFAEDDVAAGDYELVKRWNPLASNARWLGEFVLPRLQLPLSPLSLEQMDMAYPGRVLVGGYPRVVCEVGVINAGSNDVRVVEAYPIPTDSEMIGYIYYALPSTLTLASNIPTFIEAYILKEGVLIDAYRKLMNKHLKAGNVEQAGFYRNEYRTQETRWKNYIEDMVKQDRGMDDISFILTSLRATMSADHDNERTAHDYVYNRWSPLS